MLESGLWDTIQKNLGKTPGLHMERIENLIGIGTPDVNLCYKGREAWVELKLLREFPKRPTTTVKIPHFKAEQLYYLQQRTKAGGRAWLFVQVQGEGYFLFHPDQAAQIFRGELTQEDWWMEAHKAWSGRCLWGEWLGLVSGGIYG